VEIRNTTDQPISLAGLEMSQSLLGSDHYLFPNVMLPAGGYQIIFCDSHEELGPWHAPFKISRAGDTLILIQRDAQGAQNFLDRAITPTLVDDAGYARLGKQGPFRIVNLPSPGAANMAVKTGMEIFTKDPNASCQLLCRPRVGGGPAQLQTATSLAGPWTNVGAPTVTPAGTPGVECYYDWSITAPRQFFRMAYP
jgi:hypothetical protein